MSGRIFTKNPKPASATTRRPDDPVQQRRSWMREPFRARPGQPPPYYVNIPPEPDQCSAGADR